MPVLPDIPLEVVAVVPGGIARIFRVLPVSGDFEHVVFLCAEPLSSVQEENVRRMMGRTTVEFADPAQHAEIHRNIDALICHYYPSETTPMLASA